jgi:hypothetical protein
MTRDEILNRMSAITVELSDIYYENKHATVDMGGNRRTSLSLEWAMLGRMLDANEDAQ